LVPIFTFVTVWLQWVDSRRSTVIRRSWVRRPLIRPSMDRGKVYGNTRRAGPIPRVREMSASRDPLDDVL
jgi:hypothetical protein